MYLEKINSPEDIKKLNIEEMKILAQEIREAIIKRDAIHGGHFGPNLGMVEATIALHYVFDSPKDKFVFDVSHQTYPHKILTGRRQAFTDEAHYDDVTGYSNQHESEHDHFILGHTSTSISLALGIAKARDVKGEKGNVIAIIGDGSLSGGEALEGLDLAGELKTNFIVIANDNDMSIGENVGFISKFLKRVISSGKYQNFRENAETNIRKYFYDITTDELETPFAFVSNFINSRIQDQRGVFTIHGIKDIDLLKENIFCKNSFPTS